MSHRNLSWFIETTWNDCSGNLFAGERHGQKVALVSQRSITFSNGATNLITRLRRLRHPDPGPAGLLTHSYLVLKFLASCIIFSCTFSLPFSFNLVCSGRLIFPQLGKCLMILKRGDMGSRSQRDMGSPSPHHQPMASQHHPMVSRTLCPYHRSPNIPL